MEFETVLNSLRADLASLDILAEYLGYTVGKSPINPESDWRIFFSDKIEDKKQGVIAAIPEETLTNETNTAGIRKLYQGVRDLTTEFGISFSVKVVAFVGDRRVVFFPATGGNRDTRLDMNLDTIQKDLYITNLDLLKGKNIEIEADEFGFGDYEIKVSDDVFRKELTSHFLTVVDFYRKKLSELITGSKVRDCLSAALSDKAKIYLERNDLGNLVQDESYTSVLSMVVDTIILRQLMRRFLEGYYGASSFEVDGIALGVGSGTMDEAVKSTVNIASTIGEEKEIEKLNRKEKVIQEISIFDDLFDDEEQSKTSQIEIKKGEKQRISELNQLATEQFETAYAGDLFAGSISEITNKVTQAMSEEFPEAMAKMWLDTASGNYSFRYEDMPPEALEKQYEESMSKRIQMKVDPKTGKPVVMYGSDYQEQKNKGAYYTDQRFVKYMIQQTVAKEFDKRYQSVKKAITSKNEREIQAAVSHLMRLKIADFTSGGGSFLRGAFLELADQYSLLCSLELPDKIREQYPVFSGDENGRYEWEKYILEHMVYGVDIDYKAVVISSLTLTLSSLQHRPQNVKLPDLIGRTIINQNSLINSVPYYRRKEIFGKYQEEIKKLRRAKVKHQKNFESLRRHLQDQLAQYAGSVATDASFLKIESIEINLPEVYFNEDGSLNEHGGMDIVIGNPPWEAWKTNSDEFYSSYDDTYLSLKSKKKKVARQQELIKEFPLIGKRWDAENERIQRAADYFSNSDQYRYQTWKVGGRKTSSDINLYKLSIERFTQLVADNFSSSILVPDNLMTDSGSTGLRHLLFENYNVQEFLSFDNRNRIFPSVDGRYKFAVLNFDGTAEKTENFRAFFYKRSLDLLNRKSEKIEYQLSKVAEFEPEKLSLFELSSQEEFDLYVKIRGKYTPLGTSQILVLGNDFHKTNNANLFVDNEPGMVPLYEGKFMNQFSLTLPEEIPDAVQKDDAIRKVGSDLDQYRIILRSIARSTDKRSLIATLLPPGNTATHSLFIQKEAGLMDDNTKIFVSGVLNSYCLDYILRKLITTNVSLTYLKQLPIPLPTDVEDSNQIEQIVLQLLKENGNIYNDLDALNLGTDYEGVGHDELIAELNARVMIDFDLTRGEIVALMKTFESANHRDFVREETQRILNKYDTLKKGEA